jgi:tRNA(Ile)-lysidine synthetase-like protein
VESAAIKQIEVSTGRWAVGVSGGADSVALLLLLRALPHVQLHVVHLDHQTRGQASTEDAEFVRRICEAFSIPATIARREEIELEMTGLPRNASARYRAIRLELFRRVVERENLAGVILAHHADDQAETILLRLLRGSGPAGLMGMKKRGNIGGLTILRPLLDVRQSDLRKFLQERGQTWREDASNQSEKYGRNRVRQFLQSRPELREPIVALGRACTAYLQSVRAAAPVLGDEFPAIALGELPRALGRESARRWLVNHGVPKGELTTGAIDRLREMAADAAISGRQLFAGNVQVVRQRGWIRRRG